MKPQNSTPNPPPPQPQPQPQPSALQQQQQQQQQQQAAIARFPSNIDAHLRPLGVYRPLNINPNPNPNPNPTSINGNSTSNLSLGLGLNPVNPPIPNFTYFRPHLQTKANHTPSQPQPQPTPPVVDVWRGQPDAKRNLDASNRDKVVDDAFFVVRDRKVRISGSNAIYALCRSWLRNGYREESQLQPHSGEVVKTLPKPLPLAESSTPEIKEINNETNDEDKNAAGDLSAKELLQRHIKRAKRVRERLKEERMRRINRYKSRLTLLLPPPIEQCKGDIGPP